MTAQASDQVSWFFAIKWIAASEAVLFIAGYILGGTFLLGSVLPAAVVVVMAYALWGAVLGAAQGWAMPNFSKHWGRWALLTMIGFAGSMFVVLLLRVNLLVCIGIASGVLQWTILRRQVRWAGLWIFANALAWLLAALWETWGLLLIGPITGLTMMWLLNHPKQSVQVTPAVTQIN
jgi:hypothetical protein